MKPVGACIAVAAALLALPAEVGAASSTWHETQGGRIRLVTSGVPDAKGDLQGALVVDLLAGWKTYWRDPGDAGVPPSVDVSRSLNVSAATIDFPPPARHDDGYSKWAGYDHPVAFPITFAVKAPGQPVSIRADIFIGVCELICIPVQARLELDPGTNASNAEDAAVVLAAADATADAPRPDFGAWPVSWEQGSLTVEARVPDDSGKADLFVAGADGYLLGIPQAARQGATTLFTIPIVERPAVAVSGKGLHYTLVTKTGAVSGILPYP